jgi:phage tail-like protein
VSNRKAVTGLESPHPLLERLPAILQDDPFMAPFTGALDTVLAPAMSAIDCLSAYLDPMLTPEDFLPWLAQWLGVTLDENWSIDKRRSLLAETARMCEWRGTSTGIAELIRLHLGVEAEVEDSGGTSWSAVPGSDPPGQWPPRLLVRVRVADTATVDPRRVESVVADAVPAHVAYTVEVVGS